LTETARPLGADSDTVNVAFVIPTSPSTTLTSLTERVGIASSSLIVPVPCASWIVTLTPFVRLNVNVSFASSSRSPMTGTETCCDVWPAVNVAVPLVAV
jgi:hypothetical protein